MDIECTEDTKGSGRLTHMWQSVGSGSLCPFSVQSSTTEGGVGASVAKPKSQKGAVPVQGCDGSYVTPEA